MRHVDGGRVAIVTGAGRGIGRAHARLLASQGWRVVVNDLGGGVDGGGPSAAPADEVVEELRAGGAEAVASHHDVAREADAVVACALDTWGRVDAVVANAGILRSGLLLRTDVDAWRAVLEVHVLGTMAVTKAAGSWWRERAKAGDDVEASVVTTSSAAGLYGFVGEPAYSAAKAGVLGFTLTAAAELARYGVRVNAVAPAALTRMTEGVAPATDAFAPERVSPVVAWLCDRASSPVTGRVFEVGGGVVNLLDGWQRAEVLVQGDEDPLALGARVRAAVDRLPDPVPVHGADG